MLRKNFKQALAKQAKHYETVPKYDSLPPRSKIIMQCILESNLYLWGNQFLQIHSLYMGIYHSNVNRMKNHVLEKMEIRIAAQHESKFYCNLIKCWLNL